MIVLYNSVLLAGLVLLLPLWVLLLLSSPRLRRDFGQRLRALRESERPSVWLHAASVGEVEAAVPLLERLEQSDTPLVVTTQSLTGRERMAERFPELAARLMPLDLPFVMARSLSRAQVELVALIETELWPNLMHAAARRSCPVILVSARLSDRSLARYRKQRWWLAPLLARLHVQARSDEDRARFLELGADPERVRVAGDLKLDRSPPPDPTPELLQALGPGPFLLGASTHEGEELTLYRVWRALRGEGQGPPRLLLAPRHPERVPGIRGALEREGARVGLRSQGSAAEEVVILDTLGELASSYVLAGLVFGGGTLAPVGGHNLLEAVQAGRVVVHGPHTENQRSQLELLAPLGVLRAVQSEEELLRCCRDLWKDAERDAPASAASDVLRAHRGAATRAAERIRELRSEPGAMHA